MSRSIRLAALLVALVGCRAGSGEAVVPSLVETGDFDGRYELEVEESFGPLRQQVEAEPDPQRRANGEKLLKWLAENWSALHVNHGIVRSGRVVIQEFSFVSATRSGDSISGTAIWHEDVKDPGDLSRVELELRRTGNRLELRLGGRGSEAGGTYIYERVKE